MNNTGMRDTWILAHDIWNALKMLIKIHGCQTLADQMQTAMARKYFQSFLDLD
jgi:hypothetical protein